MVNMVCLVIVIAQRFCMEIVGPPRPVMMLAVPVKEVLITSCTVIVVAMVAVLPVSDTAK